MEAAIESPAESHAAPANAPGQGRTAFRLLTALLAFGLPYAALLGFPAYVFWKVGELRSIDSVLREQAAEGKDAILGLAYTNPDKHLKSQGALARAPDLLVLGASRTLQFRSEFFRSGTRFYNAGSGVEKIRHLRAFLGLLPEGRQPRHIILGLEQCFFNPRWDNLAPDGILARYRDVSDPFQVVTGSFAAFYGDFFRGKLPLNRILGPEAGKGKIGFSAVLNDNGFRYDGSYRAGTHLHDPDNPNHGDHGYRETLGRIRAGNERFETSRTVSRPALDELSAFLDECRRRNVRVTGFLPGYAPTVWDTLMARGEDYRYLRDLGGEVGGRFAAAGFAFRDFSDIRALGSSDSEFFDGFHGSEKTMLRILIALLEVDPSLAEFADVDREKTLLESASANRFSVF